MKYCKKTHMNKDCERCFHYGKCTLNQPQVRSLCLSCKDDFEIAGFTVKSLEHQSVYGTCELCGRIALDYIVG